MKQGGKTVKVKHYIYHSKSVASTLSPCSWKRSVESEESYVR
jgi:hypothetical protein